ncbi:unnamed protein product [Ilex paraguariensis]|uniref:Uncharacterized protein n=1 Tax=Ilex paraguariensis TaxID=185542 RepID=A0ABC8RHN9_9AQUA
MWLHPISNPRCILTTVPYSKAYGTLVVDLNAGNSRYSNLMLHFSAPSLLDDTYNLPLHFGKSPFKLNSAAAGKRDVEFVSNLDKVSKVNLPPFDK